MTPDDVRPPPHGARRLVVVLLGLGLLLTAAPGAGAGRTPLARDAADDEAALRLLEQAAEAAAGLSYSGTKYVASWRDGGAATSLVDVRHEPGRGMLLTATPTAARTGDDDGLVLAATRLDPALLDVLRAAFVLRHAGEGRCTGREAELVEARRTAAAGGTVAGRFWIDRETGLLLRREVYDEQGRRLRSSAFVDLVTASAEPAVVPAASSRPVVRPAGDVVAPRRLQAMRDEGWELPAELPGGFALFEVRSRSHADGDVLHLAYSDGLSTTSLFVQTGSAGDRPPEGFVPREVDGRPVWAHDGAPARMVWSGGGRVWTLVSDAPDSAVAATVGALPHDPVPDPGVRARLGRGVSRLGGWLNPFG